MEKDPIDRVRLMIERDTELLPVVRLWILRMLVSWGGQKKFISRDGFSDDTLAEELGLGHWVDSEDNPFDMQKVRIELRKLHKKVELDTHGVELPEPLASNIQQLAALANLTKIDRQIFEFAILLHSDRALDDAADKMGMLNTAKVAHALSIILHIPIEEVRKSIGGKSALIQSGLISIDRRGQGQLRSKIDLLSDSLIDKLSSDEIDPAMLFREIVRPSGSPELSLNDYQHLGPALDVMRHHLQLAVTSRQKGVNIFLHGAPGTGKNQLAKVLAKELGCELFEVSSEDDDGDPIGGDRRLRAFRAAQSLFSHSRVLMVFDEVEDIFNDGNGRDRKSTAQTRKAWINRTLEENIVPTLWLSNTINNVDPAFIRRFDMVLELPIPPRQQRQRILQNACGDFVDASILRRISESAELAPAVVTRAASVAKNVQQAMGKEGGVAAFELLINNTLESQGHKKIARFNAELLPEVYDPKFIQADADLAEVARGIAHIKSGRMCLYGPPGTGKTAYGRWLAEQLAVPLIVKRASDLVSMWVGQTERNIAKAFAEAEQDEAILLIDEVDSFLQDRRGAQRSWEVTEVNEMLTQMESFAGIFIASTNLMDGLDQAALRRFDLKVRFDFLTAAQACELFTRYCDQLGLTGSSEDESYAVAGMKNLTPGDFAAVARQNRFRPIQTAQALRDALRAECALKEGGSRQPIGFTF